MPPRNRPRSNTTPDRTTKKWIRNASDEHAVAHGCRFDPTRAEHILQFCETQCRLYEGWAAGQLVRLMPWQIDTLSRIFGWIRWSEDWGRWIRRFNIASLWIPKKNGKSPTAAMVGLYLLVADGEPGQKVFSAAKDAKQAKIVHTHARLMVEQSPPLASQCRINATTGRIAHVPTTSFYDIVCGSNITGQEGLNGSVIIDETHVVDDRLAKTLEYAGASRSEPLRFEVSTAGNNLEGYGKRQQDYGRLVQAGHVRDDSFFFETFEAPPGATDKECAKVSTWKKANPAWGHIIKPDEFASSFKRAKRSQADLAAFKMYRLNVWQFASTPWLSVDQWASGRLDFSDEQIRGLRSAVGLDLSKTTDMTAAVRVSYDAESETAFIVPKFWLPRATAIAMQDKVPWILEWGERGLIELTEGDVIDYSQIETYLAELAEQLPYEALVYDPIYAEELTQRVADQVGIERLAFRQSNVNFWGPTADFERLVVSGRLKHRDHPVMTWQMGHATVKTDANENKRVVKPKNDSTKKVDGVVSAIMGLARAMPAQPESNFYESHDVEFI